MVLQHPVTTEYVEARDQILSTLVAMHELDVPTLWFWPNVDAGSDETAKGIRVFREEHRPRNMHFFRNMPPEDFLRLLSDAQVIVGNSSAAIREASFLGVPAVDIGVRQSGRERGDNVIHVDHDRASIRAAVEEQIRQGRYPSSTLYGDGQAGRRIAKILAEAPLTIEKRLQY
jgi:UDP-N-acetylglucosamine 2-epimerase